jgi:hypothetical protein
MLFMSESPRTTTVAVIAKTAKAVTISFPERNDAFREIVKSRRFQWDYPSSRWIRHIDPAMHGETRDRAIEMACRLLAGRFNVEAPDDFQAAIVAGAYTPEHTRWIVAYSGDHLHDWFRLIWNRPDDLYKAAMRLAGARYAPPHVAVPADSFNEVLDFAERYDFRLTAEAESLVAAQRQRIAGAVRVTVAPIQSAEPQRGQLKPGKMAVPKNVEVNDELQDF